MKSAERFHDVDSKPIAQRIDKGNQLCRGRAAERRQPAATGS
ncbi:hypothetical protein [Dactylosporangium sp. NPDC051541]